MDSLDSIMYTKRDIDKARDDAYDEGVAKGRRVEERTGYRWTAVITFFVIVGILAFTHIMVQRPPKQDHKWVDVYGQTCVQIPNPDYTSTDILTVPDLVFCERVPAQLE